MSNIDWQAYLDGSLSPELREEAERILASDPQARKRLENLKAFVAEIRKQGLTQEVPLARLHKSIPSNRRPFSWPRVAIPSLAGVAAVAFALFMYGRSGSLPEGATAVIAVTDYSKATEWMSRGTGIDLRPLRLTSAQLLSAEHQRDNGCYCVKMGDNVVHLAFSKDKSAIKSMKKMTKDGRTYLEGPDCVAFEACGLLWMTHGGSNDCRWKVASEAAAQLQS